MAFLIFALALTFGLHSPFGVGAQEAEVAYFPQTGHTLRGEFLRFYREHGGELLFGYPLTEEFVESGLRVQYFQNVRMEWHPENPHPYQVELGLLGEILHGREPPISSSEIPPADNPRRRYYPETGHTISFAFLDFFNEHGGIDIFGYPITEFLLEGGIIVQYFQRACLEWHEDDPVEQIKLAPLGEIYLENRILSLPWR
ncbi:MAG: LGFP repeat-containing protein [Anaerolineae bacterium]